MKHLDVTAFNCAPPPQSSNWRHPASAVTHFDSAERPPHRLFGFRRDHGNTLEFVDLR
jgi:hypothetical protein